MSRIQDILSKAERDGTARRTRSVADDYAPRPADDNVTARAFADGPAPLRAHARYAPAAADAVADRPGPALLSRPAPAPEAEPADTAADAPADPTTRASGALDPVLVAALAPASLAAEQYRSLRTRLKRTENGRLVRTIAVTSPAKGDGKSVTAANLALTMAQEFQERVLLVDADLRRPAVHRLFGIAESPGLADVLMGMADVDQALVTVPDYHLTVLPAGMPPAGPAELLGSTAMRRVMETLRSRFDRILVDVPPVEPLADLQILAPQVDGVLMIVRAGVTPKPAIERALAALDASKVLGLVLNEAGGADGSGKHYEGYRYIAG